MQQQQLPQSSESEYIGNPQQKKQYQQQQPSGVDDSRTQNNETLTSCAPLSVNNQDCDDDGDLFSKSSSDCPTPPSPHSANSSAACLDTAAISTIQQPQQLSSSLAAVDAEEEWHSYPVEAKEKCDLEQLTYTDLLLRKELVLNRIDVLTGKLETQTSCIKKSSCSGSVSTSTLRTSSPVAAVAIGSLTSDNTNITTSPDEVIIIPKKIKEDTHHDYLMKEMMWLSNDFQQERRRQISKARRISQSVLNFHKSKESRQKRDILEMEKNRKRLAARLGRDVKKGFWGKVERVILYKQKVQFEEERKKAMDRHLMFLVNKTELYSESLVAGDANGNGEGEGKVGAADGIDATEKITIEEALSEANASGHLTSIAASSKLETVIIKHELEEGIQEEEERRTSLETLDQEDTEEEKEQEKQSQQHQTSSLSLNSSRQRSRRRRRSGSNTGSIQYYSRINETMEPDELYGITTAAATRRAVKAIISTPSLEQSNTEEQKEETLFRENNDHYAPSNNTTVTSAAVQTSTVSNVTNEPFKDVDDNDTSTTTENNNDTLKQQQRIEQTTATVTVHVPHKHGTFNDKDGINYYGNNNGVMYEYGGKCDDEASSYASNESDATTPWKNKQQHHYQTHHQLQQPHFQQSNSSPEQKQMANNAAKRNILSLTPEYNQDEGIKGKQLRLNALISNVIKNYLQKCAEIANHATTIAATKQPSAGAVSTAVEQIDENGNHQQQLRQQSRMIELQEHQQQQQQRYQSHTTKRRRRRPPPILAETLNNSNTNEYGDTVAVTKISNKNGNHAMQQPQLPHHHYEEQQKKFMRRFGKEQQQPQQPHQQQKIPSNTLIQNAVNQFQISHQQEDQSSLGQFTYDNLPLTKKNNSNVSDQNIHDLTTSLSSSQSLLTKAVIHNYQQEHQHQKGRDDDTAQLEEFSNSNHTHESNNNKNNNIHNFIENQLLLAAQQSITNVDSTSEDDSSVENHRGEMGIDTNELVIVDVDDDDDDETSQEATERLKREMALNHSNKNGYGEDDDDDEFELLERENDMTVEELRAKYAGQIHEMEEEEENHHHNENIVVVEKENGEKHYSSEKENSNNVNDGSEEYSVDEEEGKVTVDNETTSQAEKVPGRDISSKDEFDLLEKENDMSVEELRTKYIQIQREDETATNHDSGSEEFSTADANEIDDETTLEAEERLGRDISYQEEIELLKQENEMSVEELRAKYAQPHQTEETASDHKNNFLCDDDDGSGEFSVDEEAAIDDETTLEVEEQLGRDISYQEEIELLEMDNEMSVEELRIKYYSQLQQQEEKSHNNDLLTKDDDSNDDGSEEFSVDEAEAVDDEKTLEIEERLGRDISYQEEIKLLENDNELSVEDLRAKYYSQIQDAKNEEEHENDDESEEYSAADASEVDDETTLDVEERLGRDIPYKEEIDLLEQEKEISIEELRAKYTCELQQQEEDVGKVGKSQEVDDDKSEEISMDENALEGDDETTLGVEERLGRGISYNEEISQLEEGDEMTEEELRAKYSRLQQEGEEIEKGRGMETDTVKRGREEKYDNENEITFHESLAVEEQEQQPQTKNKKHTSKKLKLSTSDEKINDEIGFHGSNNVDSDIDDNKSINSNKNYICEEKEETLLTNLQQSDRIARETTVSRPFLLSSWVSLRAYQQIGLNWLVSVQTRRLNGILADEMGLGKTLQTISLLAYLAAYKGIWGPHLIIVPTSCIVNWEMELKRFCPSFKVLCYYGSAKRRKELRTGWTKANFHHVIITSYQLAVQDAFAFKRKRWYYLILDEAHNIKNFQSQRWQTLVNFNTQRRLLLTGTPLQNNLMELWSLLHFLMPHVFRSRNEFSYWFSNPMNSMIEGNENRNKNDIVGRLHGIIRPFILRRLKKDVEKEMPGKFEHIVKCQLSRRQMFLYEEFMARSSTRVALKRKGGNFMGMMNVLMQLRKVCNHPDLFEPRSVITPFFMENVNFVTAGCIVNATKSQSPLQSLSEYIIHPLWTIGRSLPSMNEVLNHDEIKSKQLRSAQTLEREFLDVATDLNSEREPNPDKSTPPLLTHLLLPIWENAQRYAVSRAQLRSTINKSRCEQAPFPISDRQLRAVRIDLPFLQKRIVDSDYSDNVPSAHEIASTPLELLAMQRSQQSRADELEDMMKRFVFCVPKAGARMPRLQASSSEIIEASDFAAKTADPQVLKDMSKSMEAYFHPFQKVNARLTSFFPENKLIQFDAGKLQALAKLLRERKRGDHRVLIFTQMSKMLDILEAFLNLNGHTYVRLDGSTGVDARQRLMDRFNNDTKLFCFILSTRSGGLGINLTGADTVVFYDSDWNPAMDAQAQDRAHRIGQTRDVHIYRLITEHSIEENILVKAKQKRQLDFMVMDEGKFNASSKRSSPKPENEVNKEGDCSDEKDVAGDSAITDVFTKGGLRGILGIDDCDGGEDDSVISDIETEGTGESSCCIEQNMSKEQMESAMLALEDEDDVIAMRGAQKEAVEELQEFDEEEASQIKATNKKRACDSGDEREENPDNEDETAKKDDDENSAGVPSKKNKKVRKESVSNEFNDQGNNTEQPADDSTIDDNDSKIEQEFAAWQNKVGFNISTISDSLSPSERYGLQFREDIDPFHSQYFVTDEQRQLNNTAAEEDWDLDEIEQAKAVEEARAIEDGDLLATQPHPVDLPQQRILFLREKAMLRSQKKRRKLTGENWSVRTDSVHNLPYWFNSDTGEAVWDKPAILAELEAEEKARRFMWSSLPSKCLIHVMPYLIPYPERMSCAAVCRQWRVAATDISFVKHVWPVEMGALAMDRSKLATNHFCCIADAVASAVPGDTIELGDGHYWVNEPGLTITVPLRIIGDENDPSHVVIELSGSIEWMSGGGWMEGVTVRRPRLSLEQGREMLRVLNGGRVDMAHCVYNNEGSEGAVIVVEGKGSRGEWNDLVISGSGEGGCGLLIANGGFVNMSNSRVSNNADDGVRAMERSGVVVKESIVKNNAGLGLILEKFSNSQVNACQSINNGVDAIQKDSESSYNCNIGINGPYIEKCISSSAEVVGQNVNAVDDSYHTNRGKSGVSIKRESSFVNRTDSIGDSVCTTKGLDIKDEFVQ